MKLNSLIEKLEDLGLIEEGRLHGIIVRDAEVRIECPNDDAAWKPHLVVTTNGVKHEVSLG